MKILLFLVIMMTFVIFVCNKDLSQDFEDFENFENNKLSYYSKPELNQSIKDLEPITVNNNNMMAPSFKENNYNDLNWNIGKNYDFSDISNEISLVPEIYDKTSGITQSLKSPVYSDNTNTKVESKNKEYNPDIKFTTNNEKLLFTPSINDKGNKFNYIGITYNEYYDQYYLLYEFIDMTKNNNSLYNLYEYLLVKLNKDEKYQIIHHITPREKININDTVYFSYGAFNLGPLVVKEYNFQHDLSYPNN